MRLEVKCWRVHRDVVAEPSKLGWLVQDRRRSPQFENSGKTFPGHRYPYTPDKLIVTADNGNFKTAANEDILVVDYTEIAVKLSAMSAFQFGNVKPVIWCLAGEVKRQSVELPAATAASPGVIHDVAPKAQEPQRWKRRARGGFAGILLGDPAGCKSCEKRRVKRVGSPSRSLRSKRRMVGEEGLEPSKS